MRDEPRDPERSDRYKTPTWVKAFGLVALVVLALIAFILITGLGGPHGPQRHGAGALPTAATVTRAVA